MRPAREVPQEYAQRHVGRYGAEQRAQADRATAALRLLLPGRLARALDVLPYIGVSSLRGCHRHSVGHANWIASAQGEWCPQPGCVESVHVQGVCARRTHCGPALQTGSLRLRNTRGLALWGWASNRGALAIGHPCRLHTPECTDQTTCSAEQHRALVGPGPQCSVVLGMRWWTCRPRDAFCATPSQLGKGVHLVGVCWHALRTRSETLVASGEVQTCGLSQCPDRRWKGKQVAPFGRRGDAQAVNAGGIKAMGGLASNRARPRQSPQRSGGAMQAAVQPVAAGDRPTAALRLLLAGP
jgi:hypothetical protein